MFGFESFFRECNLKKIKLNFSMQITLGNKFERILMKGFHKVFCQIKFK